MHEMMKDSRKFKTLDLIFRTELPVIRFSLRIKNAKGVIGYT